MALLPAAVFAQQQDTEQRTLTLQDVKDRLKQNQKFLDEARKRGKTGDAAGIEVAVNNFSRSMEGLDRALSHGQFQGSESQRVDAFERVEKATRKNGEVLSGLLNKVPDQAKPAIQHALEVSQRGRTTALAKLPDARAQRDAAMARRDQAEQPSMAGRPEGVGRPGDVGRPSGVGRPGGGPPSGRPGGKP
jgi:hypothetical protein